MNKTALYALAIDREQDLTVRYEAARKLQRYKVNQEQLSEIIRLYSIMTVGEIAEQLDLHHTAVLQVANKLKLLR